VLGRVERCVVDASAEHSDGEAATSKTRAMRVAVDAEREAAHDGDAVRSECRGDHLGNGLPVGCAFSGAHYGDSGLRKEC
jgi:hypothetical protein